jgi:serine/threonine-protein kinase HipA
MRKANLYLQGQLAATLREVIPRSKYIVHYIPDYQGPPVSLTLPVSLDPYQFDTLPAFLEGLLPEGLQLESLLKQKKIDRDDLFSQLVAVGSDLVGAITVEEVL